MTSVAVVTIIAGNYAAYASTLMTSVAAHEPTADRFILVVDSSVTEIPEVNVISPESIGLSDSEVKRLTSIYDVMEYCTALKALTLLNLLETYSNVIFLDPDTVLFSSITSRPFWQFDWNIALTPHRVTPPPRDGLVPDEEFIMRYGVYNLGFIAVRRGSEDFLRWWNERLMWWSLKSPSSSLYTDQRWIDLASSYFNVFVTRDPTLNVAPWNIDERSLELIHDSWHIGAEPLTFAHFSGIRDDTLDSAASILGPYARVGLNPSRARNFEELCDWYRCQLRSNNFHCGRPYSFAFDARGRRITPASRRRWRKNLFLSPDSSAEFTQRRMSLPLTVTESHTLEALRSGIRSDIKRLRTSPKTQNMRDFVQRVPLLRRVLTFPTRWNAL